MMLFRDVTIRNNW